MSEQILRACEDVITATERVNRAVKELMDSAEGLRLAAQELDIVCMDDEQSDKSAAALEMAVAAIARAGR